MNLLRHYLFELWQLVVDHGLPLLALLLLAMLVPRVGRLVVRIIEQRLPEEEEATKARLALVGALVYVVQVVAYFLLAIAALTNLGVPPLGAAIPATVISAAVGFGAQAIIGDFLAGFFILSEKQFGVGDYVSFDGPSGVEGTVVALTLRTTKVRTPKGEVVIIPNGSAGVVTNYSQDWARAVVDLEVPVQAGETLSDIARRVESVSRKAIADEAIASDVVGELDVLPATGLQAPTAAGQPWQVRFRILVVVNPARQWAVERGIRSALVAAFWDHYNLGLEVPGHPETTADAQVEETPADPTQVMPATAPDEAAVEVKDDGPGASADSAQPEPEEPATRFQRLWTWGGRVRSSTTSLLVALLVVGMLLVASSDPEDANAGWLAPSYWRDRTESADTPSEPTPAPSATADAPVPADAPATTTPADAPGSEADTAVTEQHTTGEQAPATTTRRQSTEEDTVAPTPTTPTTPTADATPTENAPVEEASETATP
ncbi:mechanosensitive ion channel family protein [Corynebacterium lizhenjunii]|uniref:mechanosensitive ion channel family protein n=1 Tax=Corynebacterium lizhenjunii TaxID=2709394 RepID=UPI0013EBE34B|nr:mechanosensitive ion channel family protein [Corynebacterium lizhenjunii]